MLGVVVIMMRGFQEDDEDSTCDFHELVLKLQVYPKESVAATMAHLFCAAAANTESEYKGFPGPNARCEKNECQTLPSQESAHLWESCKTIWYLHSAFDFHKQLEFTVRPELVQLVHHLLS